MKRIICLVLALVLCLAAFAGCKSFDDTLDPNEEQEPDQNLDNAYEYLVNMYKDLGGIHAKDFDVVGQIPIDDVMYAITWTADHKDVTVRESVKMNYYTVDVPSDNAEDVEFTLTATVHSPITDETKEKTYEIKVPSTASADKAILDAAYALKSGESLEGPITLTGVITELDSYNNPTIVVGGYTDMPIYCYKLKDSRFTVGATITVTAQSIKNYNGTVEMMDCTLDSINGSGSGNQGGTDVPTDAKEILDAAYALASGESMTGPFTLTGVITELDSYNNPTIVVGGYTDMPIYCYKLKDDSFTVGATITVTAQSIKNYNGTVEMMDCTLDSINGSGSGNQGGGSESTGGTVLDLMGTTNLESNSGEQTVYSANGIVYTNDKASSTTANYADISTHAARAYKGSTVKIEYTGMTKIVITFDDYVSQEGKTYVSGFDGMTVEGATFVRNNNVLTIYFTAATNVFQSAALASQVRIESIEVFTGAVETPPSDDNEGGNTSSSYDAPVADKGYVLFVEQGNLNKTLYFNGQVEDRRFLTTESKAEAVVIYFETVDGGYHIYVKNADGSKSYINLAPYIKDNTTYLSCRLALEATPNCVWTFNETYGSLHAYAEYEGRSDTFFLATYDQWTTISLSASTFIDKIAAGNQFPARFELVEGGNTGSEGGNTGSEGGNTGSEGTDTPTVSGSASIDFSDETNRTVFETTQQVWEQNGVKLTNDKASCNVNIGNYFNPARFYANSSLTIEYSSIVKIEFTCDTAAYAEALKSSIADGNGTTVTVDGKVVTVELGTAVDSFAIATLGAQVRVNSITVYTGTEGGNTGNEGGNTGNEGGNTGNEGGNTGNEGGNTGNEGGNTGNEGGNTGDNDNTDDTPVVEVSKVTYDFKALFTETIQETTTIKSSDDILTFNLVAGEAAANKAGQFRVYQGKTGVISSTKKIRSITMTANGKDDSAATVTVYVSNDGKDFVKVNTVEISTSAENTFSFGGAYTYVKIESQGKQLQITGLTVSYAE